MLTDITAFKQLESQLRQAQKMEAIGQLAGGLAHDFNNLLTVINGYSDLLLHRMTTQDPLRKKLEQIRMAGERAASLTRQLLTFSRKEFIQPTVLNLNLVVSNLEEMLARLIGENIQLVTHLAPNLWPVRADANQLEQVIMNLVVNARDAMPSGGRITVRTSNLYLGGDNLTQVHPELQPGAHIMLTVSDTGLGMDEQTKTHLFEPFFTTKGPGRGTGLGLATVYGIVKQNGGAIDIYSEPGLGSIFKILLPTDPEEQPQPSAALPHAAHPQGGAETILLVEDHDQIRTLASMTLQTSGYTVLEAANGQEALRIAEQLTQPLHLLVTDVIMPGMSGRQVADRLMLLRPNLKVLFVSGYTDREITPHVLLDVGKTLLPKPYSPEALGRKVRELLDG